MRFTLSEWRNAPISIGDETIFAIGDVHGCAAHLALLLDRIGALAGAVADPRLIFLGDMVSKGSQSLPVLEQWALPELADRFARIDRLYGNHEQLLLLATSGRPDAEEAVKPWMDAGGAPFVEEVRTRCGKPEAALTWDLFCAATSSAVQRELGRLAGHVRVGNLVFVHAGIDPDIGVEASLKAPWDRIGGNHWAWIKAPFLSHVGGFGDLVIVHGHTVPKQHRELSGRPDPHVLEFGRLGLDGGSAVTGTVMAAQLETGRYRLLSAKSDSGTG